MEWKQSGLKSEKTDLLYNFSDNVHLTPASGLWYGFFVLDIQDLQSHSRPDFHHNHVNIFHHGTLIA